MQDSDAVMIRKDSSWNKRDCFRFLLSMKETACRLMIRVKGKMCFIKVVIGKEIFAYSNKYSLLLNINLSITFMSCLDK